VTAPQPSNFTVQSRPNNAVLRCTRRIMGLLLCAACGGSVAAGEDGAASVAPSRLAAPAEHRLTDWPGNENDPRFSPDGRWLAFDAEVDGQTDLYLLSLTNGEVRRLTDAPSSDRRPAWAPDGRTIAFQSNRTSRWAIWSLALAGGGPRLVFGRDDLDAIAPDWSSTGRLVATVIQHDPSKVYGHASPWLLPLGAGEARALTSGGDEWFARWIGSTSELVYYRGKDDEVQAVDAESGRIRSLSRGEFVGWRPVTSPDGSSLVFASNVGRWRPSLWLSSTEDPSRLLRLTTGSDDDMPSWSPDGRSIAFSSTRPSTSIVALDLATGGRTTLVTGAADPQPLDDGRLAHLTDTPHGWRLTVEGSAPEQIVEIPTPPGGLSEFAIAPAGGDLAYIASGPLPQRRNDLYLTDVHGRRSRRLTKLGDAEHPVWCDDGSLLFSSYGPSDALFRQIWRLDPATDSLHQISRSRYDKAPLQCHRGGSSITARWTSDATGIYRLEKHGSDWSEQRIADAVEGSWSPAADRLAYVAVIDGRTDLFVRTVNGAVDRMTDDDLVEQNLRWSTDGRRLLFTAVAAQRDLWMIEVPPLPWARAPGRHD